MLDEVENRGEAEPVGPLKPEGAGSGGKEAAETAPELPVGGEKEGGDAGRTAGAEPLAKAAVSEIAERPAEKLEPLRSSGFASALGDRELSSEGLSLTDAEDHDRASAAQPTARVATPTRRRIRRFERGPRVPWWHSVLPALGLALCLGCLWRLMSSGPVPNWRFGWKPPEMVGKGLVVIDPGHGGGDSGAVAQGVVEKDLNLDVGLRVGRSLRARGIDVRLTREDDHFVPLEDRVQFANALPGAVFVSIHFNDAAGEGKANPQASGIETYYCQQKLTPTEGGWKWAALFGRGKMTVPDARWAVQEGQTLAGCIQGTLIAGTGAENRGIKERSLYVTHRVLGPAVLVEGGFVSHPGEARKLGDPTYRQVLAECIAEGIVKYLHAAQTAPPAAVSP